MSPLAAAGARSLQSFPRVSGDEPPLLDRVAAAPWFSPRERG